MRMTAPMRGRELRPPCASARRASVARRRSSRWLGLELQVVRRGDADADAGLAVVVRGLVDKDGHDLVAQATCERARARVQRRGATPGAVGGRGEARSAARS
eukprot:1251521-Prymnesium_polylepis.1